MGTDGGQVTQLLKAMRAGDSHAAEELLPLVYAELHRLARSYMRRKQKDHASAGDRSDQRGVSAPGGRGDRLEKPGPFHRFVGAGHAPGTGGLRASAQCRTTRGRIAAGGNAGGVSRLAGEAGGGATDGSGAEEAGERASATGPGYRAALLWRAFVRRDWYFT